MTLRDIIEKLLIYFIAIVTSTVGALTVWLCLGQIELSKQNALILERQGKVTQEIQEIKAYQNGLTLNDKILQDEITKFRIEAASHGWKVE